MESFFSLLERRVDDCSSLLCVGLDPHVDELEAPTADQAREFCLRLVRATAPYAAAFKPNAAFFEAFGAAGWTALQAVIEGVREQSVRLGSHIPVILDAKRGDIASTAEAYAWSAFETLGADAVTLSPYLGHDAVKPFLHDPEKGIFLLCKTSNPSAGELQDLKVEGRARPAVPLYVHVAKLAREWNAKNNVGLVVGATYAETLAEVRAAAPDLWFLVPGVGAQGGDLEAALHAGLRGDVKGLLINVSRGISRPADPRKAAADLRDEILRIRESMRPKGTERASSARLHSAIAAGADEADALPDALLQAGCIRFGEFTLKSGVQSPIYIDLRQIIAHPRLLDGAAAAYLPVLRTLAFDRIAALPYAAIPIATAISLRGGYPMIYPRKEAKAYGTKAEIEGEHHDGETVVVIDDLATTGASKFEAIEKLTAAGLKVKDVVVLIDRESGARTSLAKAGYELHAVFKLSELLDRWATSGKVDADTIRATREFLKKG
jgi:uridine monophosphate synthetase